MCESETKRNRKYRVGHDEDMQVSQVNDENE